MLLLSSTVTPRYGKFLRQLYLCGRHVNLTPAAALDERRTALVVSAEQKRDVKSIKLCVEF